MGIVALAYSVASTDGQLTLAMIRFVEVLGILELFLESYVLQFQPFSEGVQLAAFRFGREPWFNVELFNEFISAGCIRFFHSRLVIQRRLTSRWRGTAGNVARRIRAAARRSLTYCVVQNHTVEIRPPLPFARVSQIPRAFVFRREWPIDVFAHIDDFPFIGPPQGRKDFPVAFRQVTRIVDNQRCTTSRAT